MTDSSARGAGDPVRGWLAEALTWMSVGAGAFLILLLCSELALAERQAPAPSEPRARSRADYSPWPNSVVHKMESQIVQAILQDLDPAQGGTQDPAMIAMAPGTFWAFETTPDILTATPSPTPVAGSPPATPTATSAPSTNFATLTPTGTPTVPLLPSPGPPSYSATPVAPTATIPSAPTPTLLAPNRPPSDAPDRIPPTGEATDYFLCGLSGSQTGGLCTGGPGADAHSGPGMQTYNFYSDPLPAGAISGSSSAHVYLNATNTLGLPSPIGMMIYAGAGSWSPLGGHTLFVPANSATPTLLDSAFAVLSHEISAGEMIRLEIMAGPGTTFYWDGEFGDSRITLP